MTNWLEELKRAVPTISPDASCVRDWVAIVEFDVHHQVVGHCLQVGSNVIDARGVRQPRERGRETSARPTSPRW